MQGRAYSINKKTAAFYLVLLLLIPVLTGACAGHKQKHLNFAAGSSAGPYYPLGKTMEEIWNKNIAGMNVATLGTGGSLVNIGLLRDGKADVIMVQNDIAYYAATGTEMFKERKVDRITGLCTLYPETVQIIARADKGIKEIADLKGKTVAVGAAGSGTEINARQILEAAGIGYKELTVMPISFAEAANSLEDGVIDAAFLTADHPTALVSDLASRQKIILLPVSGNLAEKLTSEYPFYTKINIDRNTYPGLTNDTESVAVMAMLAASSRLDEKIAEELLSSLSANFEKIKSVHHHVVQNINEMGQAGMSLKLHPGAEKYFNKK